MKQRKKSIRILHTSDIHLGEYNPVNTGAIGARAQRALKALVDLSLQNKTDLVIIAGDLFDHNRVDATIVESTLRELNRALVPVVVLPGNHDCLIENSVYRRTYFSKLASNVHIFTALEGEIFSFPELALDIWGKPLNSYGSNLHPMADIAPRGREQWQIAVAHGTYVGALTDQLWSFQISDEEIVQSRRDYVALGHAAAFRCVHNGPVKAFYSGSVSEMGTVAIVDLLDGTGVQVRSQLMPL